MTVKHLAISCLFLCLSTTRGSPPAQASQVLAMDLPQLTRAAQRVVVGEVLSVRSAWNADHKVIVTTVDVMVAETWKGDAGAGQHLIIRQAGGIVDGIEMRVHGSPQFAPGERTVLFLRNEGALTAVVGMAQGKRSLIMDQLTQRWMVQPADRSAAVRPDAHHHLLPAEPDRILSLTELRDQVRSLADQP